MGAEDPMPDESKPMPDEMEKERGDSEEQTMFIDPDMLPQGMDVKSGDVLEFKVVGKNKDGAIQICYNHDEEGEDDSKFGDGLKEAMGSDKFY